jgi:hypothetical protein
MVKNKSEQSPNLSVRANLVQKISRFFDWIAEGQAAGALCRG